MSTIVPGLEPGYVHYRTRPRNKVCSLSVQGREPMFVPYHLWCWLLMCFLIRFQVKHLHTKVILFAHFSKLCEHNDRFAIVRPSFLKWICWRLTSNVFLLKHWHHLLIDIINWSNEARLSFIISGDSLNYLTWHLYRVYMLNTLLEKGLSKVLLFLTFKCNFTYRCTSTNMRPRL